LAAPSTITNCGGASTCATGAGGGFVVQAAAHSNSELSHTFLMRPPFTKKVLEPPMDADERGYEVLNYPYRRSSQGRKRPARFIGG
jgi:hypothetical protein